MAQLMARDEREARIDDRADRFAYLVMSYRLLAIVAYRGLVERVASWELLALVVLGGVVGFAGRARGGVLTGRWLAVGLTTLVVAAAVAAALAFLRT
ncbi:MAG TPA: hypothetical protein VFC71_06625 [Candidatus Polarisedimenticolia bacterium]|nr:hypothetical protein [Candidatus Polarisedimenticolia bacterium]